MSAVPKEKLDEIYSDKSLLEKLGDRKSRELVVAFAGPIGCGIASVINSFESALKAYGYEEIKQIKLSNLLTEQLEAKKILRRTAESGESAKYKRYRDLQDAGRELRRITKNQAVMAEYAIKEIAKAREAGSESQRLDVKQYSRRRVAYLIDQIKRPEEVALLRALYRNIFYLVGVTRNEGDRKGFLEDEGVRTEEVDELIQIDRKEEAQEGQRLEKSLLLADFFVRNGSAPDRKKQNLTIENFVALIHGDKSITPTTMERGMFEAHSAGLASACLSRQVGAAILTDQGEVIATGCNDVPMAGGGLYRYDLSPRENDKRCIYLEGRRCFNDLHKRELLSSIEKELTKRVVSNAPQQLNEDDAVDRALLDSIYENTRVGSLIEFSRSVHAEMTAIVSLARNGSSTGCNGATLYTTTFPCHNCARHIVAAGITRVFYIEPYEKSMALILHEDSITLEEGKSETDSRVKFLHFEGVAPRQFQNLFLSGERKSKEGSYLALEKSQLEQVNSEYLDDYQDFEAKAVEHFSVALGSLGSIDKAT